jgi:hypothetical protein
MYSSSDKTLIHSELTILRSGLHITLKIWFILAGFFFKKKSTYLQFHTIKPEIEKIVKKTTYSGRSLKSDFHEKFSRIMPGLAFFVERGKASSYGQIQYY